MYYFNDVLSNNILASLIKNSEKPSSPQELSALSSKFTLFIFVSSGIAFSKALSSAELPVNYF